MLPTNPLSTPSSEMTELSFAHLTLSRLGGRFCLSQFGSDARKVHIPLLRGCLPGHDASFVLKAFTV